LRRLALLAGLSLVICAIAALPLRAPGASAQAAETQVTSVVTDNWPSVQVTVTALDASGQPVTGLGPQAFSAKVDGTSVPITGVTTTNDPSIGIAVVLTFDTSGSMAGAPLDQAKAAATALVGQLGSTDQAAVVAFSDQVNVVLGFTGDQAALQGAINSLQSSGNTALYNGVQQSADLAKQAPLPRRAVVLLSDGVDYPGFAGATRDSSTLAAVDSGAVFMTVGLVAPGSSFDEDYLNNLANRTHGQYLVAPQPSDLQNVYTTIGNVLRQQYVLTVDVSPLGDSFSEGNLEIQTLINGATTISGAPLSKPRGPAPTAQPTPEATPSPIVTQPPVTGEDGGSSVLPIVAAALVIVALLLGIPAFLYFRRRSPAGVVRRQAHEAEVDLKRLQREAEPVTDFPAIQRAVSAEETGAWLDLPDGSRHNLTTAPITIGFPADCTVRLPAGNEDALERARIWLRDGRYMLHNLSRAGSIAVEGRPATWVILEDGDTLQFGSVTLVFHEPNGSR